MGMARNGCGQSGYRALKSAVSQEFLHASTNAGWLKVDLIIFECALSKMVVTF